MRNTMVNGEETEVTHEEFEDILKTNEIVVVNFFAEWHMPCIMLAPVIEDLAEELKHIKFVKINIDDNEELKQKHNVSTMPCIIIIKSGQEIMRITGSHACDVLEEKIRICVG